MLDREIPLTEHPDYELIPRMCKFHAERGTPVESVLHSGHLWREAVLEAIWKFQIDNHISTPEMRDNLVLMHQRIDEVQRTVACLYWNFAQETINQKQQMINELHEDRLSMLGKMAASMAHEIRNPLFAIEGFLKLIKKESSLTSGRIQRYIEVIESEFNGLYRQITAFLSFSKNDGTEEAFEFCAISDLVQPIAVIIGPRMVNENVELRMNFECDPVVSVQKIAIQQILSNLLSNSIDALSDCEHEKIIHIRCEENTASCSILVVDNGPGIPAELSDRIFEPFVTSKKNGTGLGLAICKQIMENHQGSLTFATRPGETTFTLTFQKAIQPVEVPV